MAPNGELLSVPIYTKNNTPTTKTSSKEGLQRAISDLSLELTKASLFETEQNTLSVVAEAEDAKCECCDMCDEFTPEYIAKVRDLYFGKWICGLCSEAVKEEMVKNGGNKEAALEAHMNSCLLFNNFGRKNPVLYQAEAMREMLRKSYARGARAKSTSPRDHKMGLRKGGIARSSSCMPTISKDIGDYFSMMQRQG